MYKYDPPPTCRDQDLNKLTSTLPEFKLPKDILSDQLVFEKKILKNTNKFSLIIPLEREHGPLFKQILISFIHKCYVPGLVKIGPLVLKKKSKKKSLETVKQMFR